jgi:hypothetical protein
MRRVKGAELVAECRRLLRDTELPQLWDDAEILRYLNRALDLFAESTHAITDFDPTPIPTVMGESLYTLPEHCLSLHWLRVVGDNVPLRRMNSPVAPFRLEPSGVPRVFGVVGPTPLRFRVYPTPDAVYEMEYTAAIRPPAPFGFNDAPTLLDSRYHLDLVYGAADYCLRHSDTDGFAPEAAVEISRRWDMALRNAKREVFRRLDSFNTIAVARRV